MLRAEIFENESRAKNRKKIITFFSNNVQGPTGFVLVK
jgi:hypothetical protein